MNAPAAATTSPPVSDDAGETEDAKGGARLGKALDVAGICAGVVLGVILFDVFSGGRITRWVQRRRAARPADTGGGGCPECDQAEAVTRADDLD